MRDIKGSRVKRDSHGYNMGPQVDERDNTMKVEVISSFFALVGTRELCCLAFAHISTGREQKGSGETAVREH